MYIHHLRAYDANKKLLIDIDKIQIQFTSLIRQKIKSILIISPKIFIKKYKKNHYNFSSFFEKKISSFIPNIASKSKKNQFLAPIKIQKLELHYEDPELLHSSMKILHTNISLVPEKNKYAVIINGTSKILNSPLEVKGNIDVNSQMFSLKIAPIKINFAQYQKIFLPLAKYCDIKGSLSLKNIIISKKKTFDATADLSINCEKINSKIKPFLSFPAKNVTLTCSLKENIFSNIKFSAEILGQKISSSGGYCSLTKMNIPLHMQNITLNDNLWKKLETIHPKVKEIKQDLNLKMRGNANIKLILNKKQNRDITWQTYISILDTDIKLLKHKSILIKNLNINAYINKNYIAITKGKWELFNGRFIVHPQAKIYWKKRIFENLSMKFSNVHVTRKVWDSIPRAEEAWDFLQMEGVIDGEVTFPKKINPSISKNLKYPIHFMPKIKIDFKNATAKIKIAPIPIKNITGSLIFDAGLVKLQNFHCKTKNYQGSATMNAKMWPLTMPKPQFDFEIICSKVSIQQDIYDAFNEEKNPDHWNQVICMLWKQLNPTSGLLDLNIRVNQKKSQEKPTVYTKARVQKAAINYKHFKYPLIDVNGIVIVKMKDNKQKVSIKNFSARNKEGYLYINGAIVPKKIKGKTRVGFILEVKGKNVVVDDDLRNAFDIKTQKIWNEFSPKGHINGVVVVKKPLQQERIEWRADIELNNAKISNAKIGYPIENITGKLIIEPGNFQIQKAEGYNTNNAKILLDGQIKGEEFNLNIVASDVIIDQKLLDVLPKGEKIRELFDVQGKFNCRVHLEKSSNLDWNASIDLKNISGYYRKFPYYFDKIYGNITVDPKQIKINNCHLKNNNTNVTVKGFVGNNNNYAFDIKAQDVKVNKYLYNCLPKSIKQSITDFTMAGIIDLKLKMESEKMPFSLVIFPKKFSFEYLNFPYQLTNITSKALAPIKIEPGIIQLKNLYSDTQHGKILINGAIDILENGKTIVDLRCNAKELMIDNVFYRAVKPYFSSFLETLKPSGKVKNIDFSIFFKEEEKEPYFRYEIKNMNLQSQMSSSLRKLDGYFSFNGFSFEGKHKIIGKCHDGILQIENITLSKVKTDIKFFSDYLLIEPFSAKVCNGDIKGKLTLDTSNYGAYKGDFDITSVELTKLVQSIKKKKKVDVSGDLSGFFEFEGTSYSTKELTGNGRIDVKNGNLWEFPIFLAIFDLFSLPSKPSFSEGSIRFSLSPKVMQILSLSLESSLLTISGIGNIKNKNYNVRLRASLGSKIIPRIPIISEMWNYIKEGVMGISLTGTIENPSVSFLHWKEIQDLIRGTRK